MPTSPYSLKSAFLELVPSFVRQQLRNYRIQTNVPNPLGREFKLPERTFEEIFGAPAPASVQLHGAFIRAKDQMCSPLFELFNIAAICALNKPGRVFEIGTYIGISTLIMAANVPDSTQIFTLDLPANLLTQNNVMAPDENDTYEVGMLLQNDSLSKRVMQLYGDSTKFDFSPYYKTIDLIFVDGNHEYNFVKQDSLNAFKMLRPGGCIIWDDYYWDYGAFWCAGVTQYLNELSDDTTIFRLAGTKLGVYVDGTYNS